MVKDREFNSKNKAEKAVTSAGDDCPFDNARSFFRKRMSRLTEVTENAREHRVFHFEMSISAPRLDLGSKPQQILTLARARSVWDFQPLGTKTRAMPVDFSDALDVKPVR
jgi:hypothetical protein